MTIQGRVVDFRGAGGDPLRGLLYEPDAPAEGERAGLVLVHDVYGLEKPVQDLAARFALAGLVVLVPDLWSRGGLPGPHWDQATPAPTWSEAEVQSGLAALPDRRVLADLEAARARLVEVPRVDARRIGVLGIGHGATFALLFACTSRALAAAALCGGRVRHPELSPRRPSQPLELALNLGSPLLAVFGAEDPDAGEAEARALHEALERFAREHEIERVPSAGLAADLRQERPPAGAERALERVLDFLRERLEIEAGA